MSSEGVGKHNTSFSELTIIPSTNGYSTLTNRDWRSEPDKNTVLFQGHNLRYSLPEAQYTSIREHMETKITLLFCHKLECIQMKTVESQRSESENQPSL